MGSYIQMGHHSSSLLNEERLDKFSGAILSPVNDTEDHILTQIEQYQSEEFELIFDTQLYYPNSIRGHLIEWDYFPDDVETADHSLKRWWNNLNKQISLTVDEIEPASVCSPAIVPRSFPNGYYEMNNWIAENLCEKMEDSDIDCIMTVLIRLTDLTEENRSAEISSIVSASTLTRIYLVFISNTEPRRELQNSDELSGAMRLIRYLNEAGLNVLVGFSSSEIILWKAAGATSCASGKFFNLRRFTPSRWEPPARGGGQVPYWFEESILSLLRQSDLQRYRRFTELSKASSENPFGIQILNHIDDVSDGSWLALSWRQYLYWFSDFEERFDNQEISVRKFLREAENVWRDLDDNDIIFEDSSNEGRWIRMWRRALAEYWLH